MRRRTWLVRRVVAAFLLTSALTGGPASANHTPACGHVPPHSGPVGVVTCDGVRPGGSLLSCTLNFLFKGYRIDEEGRRVEDGSYIGTAGHCILDQEGEVVWPRGQGPAAIDSEFQRIGEYAYAVFSSPLNMDFALIRLDQGVPASPQTFHFGGPTALGGQQPGTGDILHHVGWGSPVGAYSATTARSTVTLLADDALVLAPTVVYFGDSGSPVLGTDRRAVGVLVAYGLIVRIERPVARAEQKLGIMLELQTAPPI